MFGNVTKSLECKITKFLQPFLQDQNYDQEFRGELRGEAEYQQDYNLLRLNPARDPTNPIQHGYYKKKLRYYKKICFLFSRWLWLKPPPTIPFPLSTNTAEMAALV
jgi:hypothetical protein